MNAYEAMFLIDVKPDDKSTEEVFNQIKEPIIRNEGSIVSSHIWSEKRRLCYPIKKREEATYYLVNFKLNPEAVEKIKQVYRLNEDILRFLIIKIDR